MSIALVLAYGQHFPACVQKVVFGQQILSKVTGTVGRGNGQMLFPSCGRQQMSRPVLGSLAQMPFLQQMVLPVNGSTHCDFLGQH